MLQWPGIDGQLNVRGWGVDDDDEEEEEEEEEEGNEKLSLTNVYIVNVSLRVE